MSRPRVPEVVIAAGGLGTRVSNWAAFLPKEFQPVGGRPGLVHVLEEAAALGAQRAVVVHHPYYTPLIQWARQVLSPGALARYEALTGQPLPPAADGRPRVDFIPQRGPYADVTSVLNGVKHLGSRSICVAFADNIYPGTAPLAELVEASSPETSAVLASPFDAVAAQDHGVIICSGTGGVRTMQGLVEKPDPDRLTQLLAHHGSDNLRLLQGRARLTAHLVRYLAGVAASPHTGTSELKLSVALGAYALRHRIEVITTTGPVVDLGKP